jgi:hypothetical protein
VVDDGDAHAQVVGGGLGVLDGDVEEAVVGEDAGVGELELGLVAVAGGAGGDQVLVGVGGVRVAIERAHVAVRRRVVEVPVALLDVLAVVALGAGDAEQALLEDAVATVPQGEGEAEELLVVGDAEEAVLVPAEDAAACVLVREVGPGVAVLGVVLADGGPGALAEVGAEEVPASLTVVWLGQSLALGVHRLGD